MTIEVPQELESVLKFEALRRGLSAERYVCEVIERELMPVMEAHIPGTPPESVYGVSAKCGGDPSEEEIDQNPREYSAQLPIQSTNELPEGTIIVVSPLTSILTALPSGGTMSLSWISSRNGVAGRKTRLVSIAAHGKSIISAIGSSP